MFFILLIVLNYFTLLFVIWLLVFLPLTSLMLQNVRREHVHVVTTISLVPRTVHNIQ